MQMKVLARSLRVVLVVSAASAALAPTRSAQDAPVLRDARMRLNAIADSSGYFIYFYAVINAASSTTSVAVIHLGVAATAGTPAPLPATGGLFHDFSSLMPGTAPRAPVGPITPNTWESFLNRDATITWFGRSEGPVNLDSIAPGASLEGFGVRSPFLPGVTTSTAEPTWQSCCARFDPGTGEHPRPVEFQFVGRTIAPRYDPNDVTLATLGDELDAACAVPPLIQDAAACRDLKAELSRSVTAGPNALSSFRALLDQRRVALGPEAYWLLSLNADHILQTQP